MKKFANWVVHHKALILIVFVVLTVASALLIPLVTINYNLAGYVPDSAPSTVAMDVMAEEFTDSIPNARVYVPDVSLQEALQIKERMLATPHVSDVLWLDDFYDLKMPIEMANPELLETYYHDRSALFQVVTELDDTVTTKKALQEIAGESGAVEGQLIDLANAQAAIGSEIAVIMAFMIPLGVLILMLATESWISPLFLLISISIAILINMGTNIFKADVSFLTQAVTAILQFSVSMDYGIFLLHRYEAYRAEGLEPVEAMRDAIAKSSNSILASSLTTVFGFLALVFMRFQIGPDLGIVLAKGVLLSLVSVLLLLPVMILMASKWVEKTRHRKFLPSFKRVANFAFKVRLPVFILVAAMIIPAFLAQQKNDFIYGNADYNIHSKEFSDRALIEEKYGKILSVALLVPKGEWGTEKALHRDLEHMPQVKSILSYESQVSRLIPSEMIGAEVSSSLLSKNYSRIILTVRSEKEGPAAFALVEELRAVAEKHYPEKYHLLGESVVTYDMKETIQKDNAIVNGLAIVTVGLVVMLSFQSFTIPLLLLLTIEASIWFNLSVPYLTSTPLSYIGYLIISTIQLGATVDYGILFSQHYLDNRAIHDKRTAAKETISQTFGTLLPPALILTLAGLILNRVSSLAIVAELGEVLARGASFSFLMVIFFLPTLLILFDGLIHKTTLSLIRKRREKHDEIQ